MVLCVSNVTWIKAGTTDDGLPTIPHPKLEVTDGWYRLRAQVDAPLARAIRKGVVQVGRKIAIAGAKVRISSYLCWRQATHLTNSCGPHIKNPKRC
jgi:breast cancer 2 susceptibility protein